MGPFSTSQPQEFNDLLWGTLQPVMSRAGGEIASIRARGSCSVAVNNSQLFHEFYQQCGDADGVRSQVRTLVVGHVRDALQDVCSRHSDVAQAVAAPQEVAAAVHAKAEPDLNTRGLTLKQFNLHGLDKSDELLWGTAAPITFLLGGAITSVCARGGYAVAVNDPQRVGERIGDVSGLRQVTLTLARLVEEAVIEASAGKSDVAEIMSAAQEIAAAVKAKAESSLSTLGLTLTQFSINSIEKA